jgi:hypothetical protein
MPDTVAGVLQDALHAPVEPPSPPAPWYIYIGQTGM